MVLALIGPVLVSAGLDAALVAVAILGARVAIYAYRFIRRGL
jgi:hypothetical protein